MILILTLIYHAIKNNKISITPLTIDLTNFDNLNFLNNKNN